jgi:hypothetical protein
MDYTNLVVTPQAQWDPSTDSLGKRRSWATGVAACLSSKCEVLSSNPSTTPKEKKLLSQALVAHICNPNYLK